MLVADDVWKGVTVSSYQSARFASFGEGSRPGVGPTIFSPHCQTSVPAPAVPIWPPHVR